MGMMFQQFTGDIVKLKQDNSDSLAREKALSMSMEYLMNNEKVIKEVKENQASL